MFSSLDNLTIDLFWSSAGVTRLKVVVKMTTHLRMQPPCMQHLEVQ